MKIDYIVHGVPKGFDYWGEDKKDKKIETFYAKEESQENIRFVAETLNGLAYYTFLRLSLNDVEGRSGAYFGMTLRSNIYIKDLYYIYNLLHLIYVKQIQNVVVEDTGQSGKFMLPSLDKKSQLWLNIQEYVRKRINNDLNDSDIISSMPKIKNQSFICMNVLDAKGMDVLSQNHCKIYLSDSYPTKNQKDAEKRLQHQLEAKNTQYGLLDKEKFKIEQENRQLKNEVNNKSSQLEQAKSVNSRLEQRIENLLDLTKHPDFNKMITDLLNKTVADLLNKISEMVCSEQPKNIKYVEEQNFNNNSKDFKRNKLDKIKKWLIVIITILVGGIAVLYFLNEDCSLKETEPTSEQTGTD